MVRRLLFFFTSLVLLVFIGPISVSLIQVPLTMQTLVIMATVLTFRWPAFCAVLVYIGLGLYGLPVWSGFHTEPDILTSPSAGFVVGFVFMAWFIAVLARKREERFFPLFLISLLGHAVLLATAALFSAIGKTGLEFTKGLIITLMISSIVKSFAVPAAVFFLRKIRPSSS